MSRIDIPCFVVADNGVKYTMFTTFDSGESAKLPINRKNMATLFEVLSDERCQLGMVYKLTPLSDESNYEQQVTGDRVLYIEDDVAAIFTQQFRKDLPMLFGQDANIELTYEEMFEQLRIDAQAVGIMSGNFDS